jgi:hypothetical protein
MQGLYRRRMAGIALLAGIVLCLVSPASAGYTFTTIDKPGGYNSQAYGINNSGDIVGSYSDAGGTLYSFLDVGGIFTSIDIPGASITQAIGINDSGNIVGSFLGYTYWGFLDVGGSFTVIDSGAYVTFGAYGINNSGHIVGTYLDADQFLHGFLDVGETFTAIDFPNAIHTQANGINDSGEIVGFYNSGDGTRPGFLDAGGTFTAIDFPGGSNTQAYGINNSGGIVGIYTGAKGIHHGFLDIGGSFVTIDFPGARETFAYGINSAGLIAGQYIDTHGNSHGFLATPSSSATVSTPEKPGGPASGITGTSYAYSTGGSVSSLGNPVEYQFDWKGDGSDLSAFGPAAQSKTWTTPGTYNVRARARDTVDTLAVSNWSSGLPVTIIRDPNAPVISVTPTSYDFGIVKVKRGKAGSFIVRNIGTTNISIATSITGADASLFKITSGSGSRTIKPGKTLTIKVTFKPVSVGAKTSTLEITSNDPNASSIEVPLSGTGQ